jgi:hypothetical protein
MLPLVGASGDVQNKDNSDRDTGLDVLGDAENVHAKNTFANMAVKGPVPDELTDAELEALLSRIYGSRKNIVKVSREDIGEASAGSRGGRGNHLAELVSENHVAAVAQVKRQEKPNLCSDTEWQAAVADAARLGYPAPPVSIARN